MNLKQLTVNYHLTKACNMRCKFCYATFTDLESVKHDFKKSVQLIQALATAGFGKITFAGGEPTLVKQLPELVRLAKSLGMTTCVVTNGSRLLDDGYVELLAPHLDWLALSIDSLQSLKNINSGRVLYGKRALDEDHFAEVVSRFRKYQVKIKINTVVSKYNKDENLSKFILETAPDRWKVLQVMPVEGQNSENAGQFEIAEDEFVDFLERHRVVSECISIVPEENELIRGSYVMVSPDGSFFDSSKGYHSYSKPILDIGVKEALQQIYFDFTKFCKRGGLYQWDSRKIQTSLITLSGEVGSGKSSAGRILADLLGWSFESFGNSARKRADEMGMSIVDFQKYCQVNPEFDCSLDAEYASKCNKLTDTVIDFRMGYRFIENGFHVFLCVGLEEAKRRLKIDMREGESAHTIEQRNSCFKEQFMQNYGEDYTNVNNYDLVINTEHFSGPEEVAEQIFKVFTGIAQ